MRVFAILFLLVGRPARRSPLFPYTTLFRSVNNDFHTRSSRSTIVVSIFFWASTDATSMPMKPLPTTTARFAFAARSRSEEHTSELQSRRDLVCRLLLEKKKRIGEGRQLRET